MISAQGKIKALTNKLVASSLSSARAKNTYHLTRFFLRYMSAWCMPLSAPFWVPKGVHHHADIMQESSCLFAQAGERPRLYERLLYSAGHPTSGVRHNDEQEQYNDIVTCVKENYSAEPSVLLYVIPKNSRPLRYISTMAYCEMRFKFSSSSKFNCSATSGTSSTGILFCTMDFRYLS